MKDSYSVKVKIEKSQEKQFIRVPFTVPEDVERLTVSYAHKGDNVNSMPTGHEKNVIDFLIITPDGVEAGASGSNKKRVTLSSAFSTPGYDRMEIKAGQWQAVLGAYMIMSEGVEVTVTAEFEFKRNRWLKGDTHLHSVNSDGKLTIEQLGAAARKKGLDYMVITDHNNFFHNKRLPQIPDLTIIPGVEFTHYSGHINIIGLASPYTGSYVLNSFEEFVKKLEEPRSAGAILSVNHPFCSLCPWLWPLEGFEHEMVEVWNGPMRKDNLTTIEWWHKELCKGRKLAALGGSDFHWGIGSLTYIGMPTACVYAKSNSAPDILEAMRKGRVSLKRGAKAPMLTLECGDAVMGDSVKFAPGTKVRVSTEKLKRGQTLVVYDADGVIFKHKANKTALFSAEIEVKNKGFVRAEVRYTAGILESIIYKAMIFALIRSQFKDPIPEMIAALTNPIYFE